MMSREVRTGFRVWTRVVCIVAPGKGRHRIYTRFTEIDAELQRAYEQVDALQKENRRLRENSADRPTVALTVVPEIPEVRENRERHVPVIPVVEDAVCPQDEDSVGGETLTDIPVPPVIRGTMVWPLAQVSHLTLVPQQKKESGQGS